MQTINFFSEDIQFDLPNKKKVTSWITKIIKNEGFSVNQLNFIFCGDNYLQKLNRKHLGHDTSTDVLTFDHAGTRGEGTGDGGRGTLCAMRHAPCAGDIFISIDRVKENARDYDNSFPDELARVMIHGILHLLGYRDKTAKGKASMREKEDDCLSLRVFK